MKESLYLKVTSPVPGRISGGEERGGEEGEGEGEREGEGQIKREEGVAAGERERERVSVPQINQCSTRENKRRGGEGKRGQGEVVKEEKRERGRGRIGVSFCASDSPVQSQGE